MNSIPDTPLPAGEPSKSIPAESIPAERVLQQRPNSESDFLAWVRTQQKATGAVVLPAGDDLAVMRWNAGDWLLVGTDQVLDGVHFDSNQHDPASIGRKAMNRNLSDCAAMGCLPAAAVVSVALPSGARMAYAQALYEGVRAAGERFDCPIVGGDTGSWSGKLIVTVTIIGRSAGVEPVTRNGAAIGDGIYVTGALGGSILGRHLVFEPRIAEGRQLAQSGVVSSMIDLSDGLSRDLPRLLQRVNAGARLDEDAIPIHADARIDRADGRSPLEHALHDGEDYELLFTARETPPLGIWIGTVQSADIQLVSANHSPQTLEIAGWNHSL